MERHDNIYAMNPYIKNVIRRIIIESYNLGRGSNDLLAFRTCYRESPRACIYEERRIWGRLDRMWIQYEASR